MTRSGRIARAFALTNATFALLLATSARVDAAGPPTKLLEGPYLTGVSESGADVRFELDAPGPATVEVSMPAATPDAGGARRFADATVATNHLVHLTGLEPAKIYPYSVLLGTQIVGRGTVSTVHDAASGVPLRFIVYGDSRSDPTTHAAIVRAIQATPSDFLVNTGDIVADGGNLADWQSFFAVEQPLLRDRPLYLCIGNHELYDDEAGANFARYFGFVDATGTPHPYGTARVGNVRLFLLNGMHDWGPGEERAWLERELGKADGEPGLVWRVAVVHHSPWSAGPHGPNAKLVSAHVPELLAAHHVDLLLAGHDHIYERGQGVGSLKYVISGGSGASLYKVAKPMAETHKAESAYHFVEVIVTATAVRTVAHRLDGSILETCGFQRGMPWDCDSAPATVSPAAPAAPAAPASSSRCSVSSPGAAPGHGRAAGGGLALLVATAAAARRRRRCGGVFRG